MSKSKSRVDLNSESSGPEMKQGSELSVAPWFYPRLALLFATLVAANPVVMLALIPRGEFAIAIVVGIVVALQAAYQPSGKSTLFSYAVNFLILGATLLHAEYALRTFLPNHVVPNIYALGAGYSFNVPFLDLTFEDDEYRAEYLTSVQGFRIGEIVDPHRVIEKADWIFIGDSFTQGAQVPFDALYTSQLYGYFPNKVIVNLGASGLGIAEELALYRDIGARLSPGVVFLQISPFNDFMNVEPRRTGISERLMEASALYRTVMQHWSFQDPNSLPLRRWTEPFYPDVESNRQFNVFYRDMSSQKERDLELFRSYLGEFKEEVEKDGGRLVVVLLPTREQTSDAALAEVQSAFSIEPDRLDMSRPNDLVAEMAETLGVQVIDLLPRFRDEGGTAFFEWDEHMTIQGHAAAADGIADVIATWTGQGVLPARISSIDSARYPRTSCGMSRITFQAPVRGQMEVFSIDLTTQGVVQLTFDGSPKSHPMLSNNCQYLLYTQGAAEGMRTEVVLQDLPTGQTFVLTSGLREFGAIATFSPDNRQVAFAEWYELAEPGFLSNPAIALLDLESGQKRYLTDGQHESWRPTFSSDGQRLAYITNPTGQFDVYQVELATAESRQLTRSPYDEWDPSYDQSGQLVLYSSRKDGNWDLFSLDLMSGLEQQLTQTAGDEWDAVFHQDRESILFAGEFGMFAGIFEMRFAPNQ